jgi:divalent metal cation (Fe/Co/Zn/Cd) transporter
MTDLARSVLRRRGRRLAFAAIAYMTLEGGASLVAGTLAGSVALVGFGLDSVIELASNSAAGTWQRKSPQRARA